MNIIEALKASGDMHEAREMDLNVVSIFPDDVEKYVHIITNFSTFTSDNWEPGSTPKDKKIFGVEPAWRELHMAQELFDAAQTIFDICLDHMCKDDIAFIKKACAVELKKLKITEGE